MDDVLTLMERHAALGPIAWTDGGMRATTSDGYVVAIMPSSCDPPWTVWIDDPPNEDAQQWRGVAKARDLRDARAIVAEYIGHERDRKTRQREAASHLWHIAHRVMEAAQRGMPGVSW